MSWFFGKKKHHRESPPDTPEDSSLSALPSDDYIIVEQERNPGAAPLPSLYPHLGGVPVPPITSQQKNQSVETQSYLSGVPFKLSKTLDHDFEIERLRIDEITSFVHRIINEDYDYEFTLERSIINEMDSGIE